MKITAILLTVLSIQLSAAGYSQTITLSLRDASLKKVFNEISKQTGYNFFYGDQDVQKASLVNLDVQNASLKKVLELCFKNQPLDYVVHDMDKLIVVRSRSSALSPENPLGPDPPLDMKGKVVNERGEPVAGASVRVKGSDKGTSTNEKGEFNLAGIEADAILVVSGVNIETVEWKVNNKTELTITAKIKVTEGEEVTVNTGYQKIPPNKAAGSFELITNEDLNRRVGSDILSRLEGVNSVVLFDRRSQPPNQNSIEANNIIIRGITTFTETMKTPLIVVNNFPYEGDISNINPNDVENITILKDASAASIWGARAANGVIVITTKQGRFNQPATVSLNTNLRIGEKPDLFHYPRMSANDFIGVEIFLFNRGFYNADLGNNLEYPDLSPVVEILQKRRTGQISASDSAAQINALRDLDIRSDFAKYLYRSSVSQQYSLSLSGGTQRLSYTVRGGFDKNLSTLVRDQFHRTTLYSNLSFEPVKNLEFGFGLGWTNSVVEDNSLYNIGAADYNVSGVRFFPYTQFADINGNPLAIARDYRAGYTDTAGGGKLLDWKYRPLQELSAADNTFRQQNIVFNFNAGYRITAGLRVELGYQYQDQDGRVRDYQSEETYNTRNLINLFTRINGNTVQYVVPRGGILRNTFHETRSQAGRAQLNFTKNYGNMHEITAIAGGEIREAKRSTVSSTSYGFDENTLSYVAVDYVNTYPRYGGRSPSQVPEGQFFSQTLDRFVSLYGNASYIYSQRYTLSASMRKDAANLFGVEINNKWKPFWSFGGAWDISEESFYKLKAIESLRMRATYGHQGNVNNSISPYTILTIVSASGSINGEPRATIQTPGNKDLSWETIGQLNLAIDFTALRRRIKGSIEFFRKYSKNILTGAPVDPTTGITSVVRNNGSMMSKGWEFALQSLNLDRRLKWTTNFNFNSIDNKVIDYLVDISKNQVGGYVGGSDAHMYALKGRPPYSVFSYPFAGLDPVTGSPRGYLGKQISTNYLAILRQTLDTADIIYHGSAQPRFFGSLINKFSFKGFSLSVNIRYHLGYYFKKNTISYVELYNQGRSHPDFAKRWQHPGDEQHTSVPSMIYPLANDYRDQFYAGASVNVLKADHIRLADIRVSYSLDKLKKLPIRSLQFYVTVDNLGIIWRANKEGLDPEFDYGNAAFPPPKSLAIGLKTDF